MRKVELRMNEQQKYEVIKKLVESYGDKKRAALKLDITVRQVDRLIAIYNEKGKNGFIHGNRNKKPYIAKNDALKDSILKLYLEKYYDFNFKHFIEYLKDEEHINVSYFFVYNLLFDNGIYPPKMWKSTKKNIKKQELRKLKNYSNKSEVELEDLINHEIFLEDSHPRKERAKYMGENVEMDASIHRWFGEYKTALHLAKDNASGIVVGGYFDYYETLDGYYNVFKQILENYGIPFKFTTDGRTIFNYEKLSDKNKTPEKNVLTQFGFACRQLGTEIDVTSVSQAKGGIERENQTFQGRLIQELRLNNITTIADANKYLIDVFIPKINKLFAHPGTLESVYDKAPDSIVINYTLAVVTKRIIDNGNSIKFKNEYYQPYLEGNIKCFRPHTEVLVIEAFDKQLFGSIDGNIFNLKKLENNAAISKEFDLDVFVQKEVNKDVHKNPNWTIEKFDKHVKLCEWTKNFA